jgi:hypothetical protein
MSRTLLRTKIIHLQANFAAQAFPVTANLDLNVLNFDPDEVIVKSAIYRSNPVGDVLMGQTIVDAFTDDSAVLCSWVDGISVECGQTIVLKTKNVRRTVSVTFKNVDNSATARTGNFSVMLEFRLYEKPLGAPFGSAPPAVGISYGDKDFKIRSS